MSFDQTEWVWVNGRMTRWAEATVHVSAHALHYGSGVFEGLRCYETARGPAVFRLRDHVARLMHSAGLHGMEVPFSEVEIEDAVREVVARNGFGDCYVRPICFHGSHSLGVNPASCPVETVVLAWPWPAYLGEGASERGVRVKFSPWVRFHSKMMPTTAKACGAYVNSTLAIREAHDGGFDEAIMLNVDGSIAEGSGENVFAVRGGLLVTNDERSSILPGITRDSVLRIAADLGYATEVREMWPDDLKSADELFFTGTAVEVTPIREVEGGLIGDGGPGRITVHLREAFFDAAHGRSPQYGGWLRPVLDETVRAYSGREKA